MICNFIAFHIHHGCVKENKKKNVERLHKMESSEKSVRSELRK